ncbi:hypothetical protein N866_01035 [Actinotalea ferrariae CF5-4]|uniref:Uncharacterized protein n=1 Tax=Actinotalea ferrariae CF5-4 TaxID=948458 RepID=A0A021VQI3_9CELL|nr:hypothetical protein [Actinotalea ferrariae]EYR63396.1 hypothetical protein N866_01035 [Actinotalea ferrariae CF5-4]
MYGWILFDPGAPSVPGDIAALTTDLKSLMAVAAGTETPDGGLHRTDLLGALAPAARAHGLGVPERDTFAASEIDLARGSSGAAVSVQTGRARSNNAALLSVLAAAAMQDIRWLVIVAPARYKGTLTARPVVDDITRLSRSRGVRLDLSGVLVLAF